MPYTPTSWQNSPSVTTPINATNLNHLETQYGQALADAGSWEAAGNSLSLWTYDPVIVSTVSITAGTIYLSKLVSPKSTSVSNVYWRVTTAASGATASQNWVALLNSSGTVLATTGVDAAITTTGTKTTAISSTALSANSTYFVAFLFNFSGSLALSGVSSTLISSISLANVGTSGATLRFSTNGTSQTTITNRTIASNAQNANCTWTALS